MLCYNRIRACRAAVGVGLEGAVREVALVLHLELVTLEVDAHGHAIDRRELELMEGPDDAVQAPVHDRLRRDQRLSRTGLVWNDVEAGKQAEGHALDRIRRHAR